MLPVNFSEQYHLEDGLAAFRLSLEPGHDSSMQVKGSSTINHARRMGAINSEPLKAALGCITLGALVDKGQPWAYLSNVAVRETDFSYRRHHMSLTEQMERPCASSEVYQRLQPGPARTRGRVRRRIIGVLAT
jgi:hypothetical protein